MSYIGRQPTAAALTASDVTDGIISTAKIADTAISTAKIADTAITNAKLNADIISADTALGAEPADTDELLVSDAGVLKRMDYSFIKSVGVSNAFFAHKQTSIASGTLVINTEILDDGGNYDTSNGRYTAPSGGKYIFFTHAIGSSAAEIYFQKNGSNLGSMGTAWAYTSGGTSPDGVQVILTLSTSDYVTVYASANVATNYLWFGGAKLY